VQHCKNFKLGLGSMTVYMTKERAVRESVKWIRENLPEKTIEDISDTIEG